MTNKGEKCPLIYCIDGNIGVGKSSVLSELENRGYLVFKEDLGVWEKFLAKSYKDPQRWTCSLQIQVLLSMKSLYDKISMLCPSQYPFVFVERSPFTAMLFVDSGIENKYLDLDEINLLHQVFNTTKWFPDFTFLLYASVDTCFLRKNERNRSYETTITKEYLQQLDNKYCQLFSCATSSSLKILTEDKAPKEIVEYIMDYLFNLVAVRK